MKRRLAAILLVVAATVVATFSSSATTTHPASAATGPGTRWPVVGYGPTANDNVILQWDEELLEYIRGHKSTGPTVTARAIGVLHTATYDAWAPYDANAVDTRQRLRLDPTDPNLVTRQPAGEADANKKEAISYAAYTTLVDLFPSAQPDFAARLAAIGYTDTGSTSTPATIGRNAANAVLAYRHGDGSFQTTGYTDPNDPTNGYTPVNDWKTPAT